MSAIVLLDTSVYLNILDVPNNNQDRETVFSFFEKMVNDDALFLLPMATIWETGNHIADLPDGGRRRRFAQVLVEDVTKAMEGRLPYQSTYFPDREEFLKWLSDFPSYAGRNKSVKKTREGVSLADMSMIKEWERTCAKNPMRRVLIWSLDSDLMGYDRNP